MCQAVGCHQRGQPRKSFRAIADRVPIIELSKAEIVRKGIELGAPLELSWSCYRNEDAACGKCDSCALRLRGFARAGLTDPISYQK